MAVFLTSARGIGGNASLLIYCHPFKKTSGLTSASLSESEPLWEVRAELRRRARLSRAERVWYEWRCCSCFLRWVRLKERAHISSGSAWASDTHAHIRQRGQGQE